ncbi:uncharacterized protein LOC126381843 [Pectinophora gossypiella]|uniref:uncharacterized protein LOC126381843 n=1 Tax=Pectinophora gossypiella TaxID=13191 RepID=UPI00214F0CC5|nr:uncharacterized protein LOC126381843 [Pectinophora gossypiella]
MSLMCRVVPVLARPGTRHYALCCPPRLPPGTCGCPSLVPGGGRRIVPPADCRPGPIPYNPCRPIFHEGHDTYKTYKYIFFFFCVPLIITQMFRALSHSPPHKEPCRDYEYMRIRTKKYPWRDGNQTLFHNDHVNNLPEDCEPPLLDCD